MIKKRKNVKKIAGVLLILIIFSGFYAATKDIYFEIAKNIDIFTRVYKEITFNYVDGINPSEFLRSGIRGMLQTLDPYTTFMDERRQEDIELITNGKYGGVGISVGVRNDKVTIIEVIDGYSAQRQGIKAGDVIFSVDSVEFSAKNYEDLSSFVKGEPGSFVKIKIQRHGVDNPIEFNLVREEIQIKNVTFYGFVPENSNNAYIRLSGFTRTAGNELRNAINDLKSQKDIESLILDLRGNPGGLLDVAVEVSNKFIKKGELIVTTKGRDSASIKRYYTTEEPMLPDVQLVVLINENSASASEIVAGAIQDHDRGIIVGTKSFGKGLVQTISPLSYNTSIKITTARYYTPSGRSIQKIDYSKNNKVILNSDSVIASAFSTDNKRIVYSAGGINPDSTVQQTKMPGIMLDLLAKGLFFEFATAFIAGRGESANLPGDDELFDEFLKFVKSRNYKYESEEVKQLEKYIVNLENDKNYLHLVPKLNTLRNDIEAINSSNFAPYKDTILAELKSDILGRIFGSKVKIEFSLKHDLQFNSATLILKDRITYNKLLGITGK